MAQAGVDRPDDTPSSAARPQSRSPWARGLVCVALLPLLGFIGQQGQTLWGEWRELRSDRVAARANAVIGYVNINPIPSYASRPADWFHHDGEEALLWAGWRDGADRWFRFGRREFDGRGLSLPIGRDAIQAIDRPIFEQGGGPRWQRIPDEAPVVGLELDGGPAAYPLRVLEKVVAVNDRAGDRPILVVFTPSQRAVSVFEAAEHGRRVIMGHSGYFIGHRPLLFDRATESLWVEREAELTAMAGRRKGTNLKRIARIAPVDWGIWRGGHPGGRLLIGADRSKSPPVD